MCHKKGFPRYDDVSHIDSAAISHGPAAPYSDVPRGDPAATAYTEMYCIEQNQSRTQKNRVKH